MSPSWVVWSTRRRERTGWNQCLRPALVVLALGFGLHSPARAQTSRTVVRGQVVDVMSRLPVPGAVVGMEGTALQSVTDAEGRYLLRNVPSGPHTLTVRRIGYAPFRVLVEVPADGELTRDVVLATTALEMAEIVVTADPVGRARGELGTASVVDRTAIAAQSATSIRGVLELIPGVPLAAPGLDAVEQIALRNLPTPGAAGLTAGAPGGSDLASFGTLIVLDGVPVSNNANLQTTGPAGELEAFLPTAARGGVDLRRIPASTVERVEVIRGVPSARYGDLTQGVIVVDTRAAAAEPEVSARVDAQSFEGSGVVGRSVGRRSALTASLDATRTRTNPGLTSNLAYRVAGQFAYRTASGPLTLDVRGDGFALVADNPERPEVFRGRSSYARDIGTRVNIRARHSRSGDVGWTVTVAADRVAQRADVRAERLRGAIPFTDRTEPGTADGRFVEGPYQSRLTLDGETWQLYARAERDGQREAVGFAHRWHAGIELRREWNAGAGYQFDLETPPQVTFNGVEGFDRPRAFGALPPVATSSAYLDDRLARTVLGVPLQIQVGARLDLLHDGTNWVTATRDAVLQPRLNVQIAARPWLRLRAAAGRAVKSPALGSLAPARQWFDVVNLNWFTPDPAERRAILTTFVLDPTNPDLGFSTATKREAGIEIAFGSRGFVLDVVAFRDDTRDGAGLAPEAGFLVRELYDLADSTIGTGQPPVVVTPPTRADTVPILLLRPSNVLSVDARGLEGTVILPELRPLHLRLHIQGQWIRSQFRDAGRDFGSGFRDFQVDGTQLRAPYWEGRFRTATRVLLTYRVVHHRPDLGLVVTGIVQHIPHETREDRAAADSLSFAGYVTRSGELVPVPPDARTAREYADLRSTRTGLGRTSNPPGDWYLSVQVSKTLPLDGRLSFYGFNLLDRQGRIVSATSSRTFARVRFGLELSVPLGSVLGWSGMP